MTDWQAKTIRTYDDSAEELAKYFKGIGQRIDDIERGLQLAEVNKDARVVEIGCGSGRDAAEIIKHVHWYEGFDPSIRMLDIARQKLPEVSFVIADALSYPYPRNVDVIYAFASLLHVNKHDMKLVLQKVSASLRPGGVLYLSLKERSQYTEEVKVDTYGERMFYYYNPAVVIQLADDLFSVVYEDHQTIRTTDWFTLALKKTVSL